MLIKTISIKQPWAWAILNGKPVENRSWASHYTGTLYIHASKTFDFNGYGWILSMIWSGNRKPLRLKAKLPRKDEFKLGGIIGKVNMVDCVKSHPSPWFFGEYGFVFDNPKPLPFFPCKGKLGIFEVDYAVK